jgi:AcrR family transcriptional regulator
MQRARANFLELIGDGASITRAAREAGIGRATVYAWRDRDPAFAAAWDGAHEAGLDMLEDRARELAMAGNERLLMFLLEAGRPQKYRKNVKLEHSGTINLPVNELTDAELEAIIRGELGNEGPAPNRTDQSFALN